MSDLAILEELNRHYIRSVQESDVGWFREHLTADFLNGNPDGTLVDRDGFLAQIARPAGCASRRTSRGASLAPGLRPFPSKA